MYIISDNCWGQGVYNTLNLPYSSPFISLFIHTPSYMKLLANLDEYLSYSFELVKHENSNHYNEYKVVEMPDQVIGRLHDVEIIFYHCKTNAQQVFDNWHRRKQRLPKDKNKILVKMCSQYLPRQCKQRVYYENFNNHLINFYKLPHFNKVTLTESYYGYPNNYKILNEHFEDNLRMGKEFNLYFKLQDIIKQ